LYYASKVILSGRKLIFKSRDFQITRVIFVFTSSIQNQKIVSKAILEIKTKLRISKQYADACHFSVESSLQGISSSSLL